MGIRELCPELAKKAKEELNEDPSRTQNDILALKEWITKQPHLIARTDDQWLVAFLRGSKFSLERAKEKIDKYYTMKSLAPELTISCDPMDPLVQEILSLGVCVGLTTSLKPDDTRVAILRFGQYDPKRITMAEAFRVCQMVINTSIIDDDQSNVAGSRVIMDLSNITLAHMSSVSISLIKKIMMVTQDAAPGRQKGMHYINFPSFAEVFLDFSKLLMSEKTKSRLYFHKSYDDLHQIVPKSILPMEYGGDAGPIQDMIDILKQRVESYRHWFLEDIKYKTDESKRIESTKTSTNLLGVEGSFRQLTID